MGMNSDEQKNCPGADALKKISQKLHDNNNSLRISRVPKKTKVAFVQLAEEEFCSDYGMLLKFLMDGVVNQHTQLIVDKLNEFEDRISALEAEGNAPKEEKKEKVKLLNGRHIDLSNE